MGCRTLAMARAGRVRLDRVNRPSGERRAALGGEPSVTSRAATRAAPPRETARRDLVADALAAEGGLD